MIKEYESLIKFNSQDKFKFRTEKYWIHSSVFDEILSWASLCDMEFGYVAEKALRRGVLTCGFAFKTEEELSLFNLTFYDKIIADQKTTHIYKLVEAINTLEDRAGKKLF